MSQGRLRPIVVIIPNVAAVHLSFIDAIRIDWLEFIIFVRKHIVDLIFVIGDLIDNLVLIKGSVILARLVKE